MTRWHAPSCERPEVKLSSDDKWPFCASCGQVCPSLEELVALDQHNGIPSVLTLPPDEPQGQMNLYWPSCVRYVRPQSGSTEHDDQVQRHQEPFQPDAVPSDYLVNIYNTPLGGDQFRVACMSAPSSDHDPVHVTLETYSYDSHPEYEAVSYLWGGENGDNSRSRPIFIGSHWDVLLQTPNCWSMLSFFRPHRGERLLWIDALCINQQNYDERAAQVAMMARIYQCCSRVVVYLGEDIAVRTTPFPRYHTLDKLADLETKGEGFSNSHPWSVARSGFSKLLSRKYFGRIWIIQELVLCERIVFSIGDFDFRIDSDVMMQLALDRDWTDSSTLIAPWVQSMTKKMFVNVPPADVYALLKLTLKSACSDPRDRLFAVIALLRDAVTRGQFSPDYTISYLHFCIGLVGSWIIKHAAYHLLHQAATVSRASSNKPTWLPMHDTSDFCRGLLSPPPGTYPYQVPRLVDWPDASYGLLADTIADIQRLEGKSTSLFDASFILGPSKCVASSEPPCINSTTGGLLLNAVHLHAFEVCPRFVGTMHASHHLFAIGSASSGQDGVLFITSTARLDSIICPQYDHLFMLDGGVLGFSQSIDTDLWRDHINDNPPVIFLVLRYDRDRIDGIKQYKLVTSKLYVFVDNHVKRSTSLNDTKQQDLAECPDTKIPSLRETHIDKEARECNANRSCKCAKCAARSIRYLTDPFLSPSRSSLNRGQKLPQESAVLKDHKIEQLDWYSCRQLFPNTFQSHQMRKILIALCCARSSANAALSMQQIILQANWDIHACISEDHLVFTFDQSHTSQRLYYSSLPLQHEKYRPIFDYPDDDFHPRLVWEARDATSDSWYGIFNSGSVVRRVWNWITPKLESEVAFTGFVGAARTLQVRCELRRYLHWLQAQVDQLTRPLERIMYAYHPPLAMEEAWDLVMEGVKEEQRVEGTVTDLGGVKLDGSMMRVEIL